MQKHTQAKEKRCKVQLFASEASNPSKALHSASYFHGPFTYQENQLFTWLCLLHIQAENIGGGGDPTGSSYHTWGVFKMGQRILVGSFWTFLYQHTKPIKIF